MESKTEHTDGTPFAPAGGSDRVGKCATCKWWQIDKDDWSYSELISPPDPVTYEQDESEEQIAAKWGHRVRYCKNPKILFYDRPAKDGAAVCDGSQYMAALLTAEDFGCTLHEPNGAICSGEEARQ